MQYFHFHPDNQPSFDTPLVSSQCQHLKANNDQCKNIIQTNVRDKKYNNRLL